MLLASLLLSSGALFPVVAAQAIQNGSSSFAAQAPTSVGPASGVLLAGGPIKVTPFSSSASVLSTDLSPLSSPTFIPYHNPKPQVSTSLVGGPQSAAASATATVPPTVTCPSFGDSSPPLGGLGCDAIIVGSGHQPQLTTNPFGLNAVDSQPFTVEPPDQGLCAGNGYVMETLNQGELQVYSSSLTPVSASCAS